MQLQKKQRVVMKTRRARALSLHRRQDDDTTDMERKLRILKKLVPNGETSMGLDGLFRDTADYIVALQTRLKLMQIMVDVLSSPSGHH